VESERLETIRHEAERLVRRHCGERRVVDPAVLAEAMGVRVLTRPDLSHAHRTHRGGMHLILLPPYPRAERRAYAIAHELGEIHLPTARGFHPPEAGESLGPEVQIERAHHQDHVHRASVWFALYLLAPECEAMRSFDPHADELAALKAELPFASHEVLAVRVAQRTDGRVTVTDNGRLTRRTGFGAWTAFGTQWHPAERRVHDAVTASGQTCRLADLGIETAGFAIFEPEVRRVILISHFDEAFQEEG
jgi:hypothetical protein